MNNKPVSRFQNKQVCRLHNNQVSRLHTNQIYRSKVNILPVRQEALPVESHLTTDEKLQEVTKGTLTLCVMRTNVKGGGDIMYYVWQPICNAAGLHFLSKNKTLDNG